MPPTAANGLTEPPNADPEAGEKNISSDAKRDDARAHGGTQPRPNGQPRRDKRDVHGWVVLDKPIGMTSTQAVAIVKRLFQAKRAGHAGTLDPLASGGLPIALGEATKTVPFVMDGRKRYRFTVAWGEERDTDDTEGRIVKTNDLRPSAEAIRELLPLYRPDRAGPAPILRDQNPGRARLRSGEGWRNPHPAAADSRDLPFSPCRTAR
jgi:tRNA pseudouridine55 synthase